MVTQASDEIQGIVQSLFIVDSKWQQNTNGTKNVMYMHS